MERWKSAFDEILTHPSTEGDRFEMYIVVSHAQVIKKYFAFRYVYSLYVLPCAGCFYWEVRG